MSLDLKDSAGVVLHWIVIDAVDLLQVDATLTVNDIQDTSGFKAKIDNWIKTDRRVCTVEFRRRADERLVDGVTVDPVGAAPPIAYNPATHGMGMVELHVQDSDGVNQHFSMITFGGPVVVGGQLFDSIAQVGNATYRFVWWDKVNTEVLRPAWWAIGAPIQLKIVGRLKFDQGVGGAAGAAGLDVFPDKPTLDPTVAGGIDRAYGPIVRVL